MTKAEKAQIIEDLREKLTGAEFFYIADSSKLPVDKINQLRRLCFDNDVTMEVAKNTLIRKALESSDDASGYEKLYDVLKGPSTILIASDPKAPAKVIKDFRQKGERPVLKAAYISSAVFIGDDQLEALSTIKSRDELIGEVITLLQSPAQNVLGALQSSSSTIAGLVKAIQERAENN